jgi:competence protein ComEA
MACQIAARLFSGTDACKDAVNQYGDYLMIDSQLLQTNARLAMPARDILSVSPRGAVVAFVFFLALGMCGLLGVPAVHAQEQKAVAVPVTSAAKVGAPATADRVNINTADAQMLADKLKGVGDARAQEIVRHREAYGPFASAAELLEVKGIGQATLDMNLEVITLE